VTQARRALGAAGEEVARAHLVRRGYTILARNIRRGGVELDIVARKGQTLVFVEVKTRRFSHQGAAVLAVDAKKRRRLVKGAFGWLTSERSRSTRVRFDVIGVERDDSGAWTVQHIERAFDAGDG